MKKPKLPEPESEGRIRLKDLLNEGMENSRAHISDVELEPENIRAAKITSQEFMETDENVTRTLENLIEQVSAEANSKEVMPEVENLQVKISPVKEWLNKEKEKAQVALAKEELAEESGDEEAVLELAEEAPVEIEVAEVEEGVPGYKIEGRVKVSGETGMLIIEKMSYEDAEKIKSAKKEITPPMEVEKLQSAFDELGFVRNKGFQRPQDVLKEWVKFTQLQLGILDAANVQLKKIAVAYSADTNNFNEELNSIAEAGNKQSEELEVAAGKVNILKINDENILLSQSLQIVIKSIEDAASNISVTSKKIESIIDGVAEAQNDVSFVETFVLRLQKITRQANMLAVNSAIEATRAGEAGVGFGVIADEFGELASDMHILSEEMHKKSGKVIKSFSDIYSELNELVAKDSTTIVFDKQKIMAVTGAVLKHNQDIEAILKNYSAILKNNSLSILQLLAGINKDSSQYIDDIIRILQAMNNKVAGYKIDAVKSIGIEISNADVEKKNLDKILSEITSEQLKKEFIDFMVSKGYIKQEAEILSTIAN